MTLAEEIKSIPINANVATDEVGRQFFAKIAEGNYARDEDPVNHFRLT